MKQAIAMVFFILLASSSYVICQTNGETKSELEVRRVDEEFHKAFRTEDSTALERLLTEKFIWTHSTGNIQTKAVILANVKSGKTQYDSLETDDVQVSLYKNAAVVSGRSSRNYPGKNKFLIRYTAFYVKSDGKWQAAAFHTSHLPVPGVAAN